MEITLVQEKCTGCAACESCCPTKAITMIADEKGFIYPRINENKCIQCGQCENICPINRMDMECALFGREVYGAWSLDEEIRIHSTSGGIFSELANWILDNNGVVIGAVYDTNFRVVYQVAEERKDVHRLRQSKYVEARATGEISRVKEYLEQGKRVLFVGTPCKVAGVKAALGDVEFLYTCDFICRGSNSPIAYDAYLKSLEKRAGSRITRVWFKNKKDGWNKFGTKVIFENGKEYFADRVADWYMRGYLKHNLFLRDACTMCQYKNPNRYADITLADFWGITIPQEVTDVEKGISMVAINTQKGQELWTKILWNIGYVVSDKERALEKNWCANNSVQHGEFREFFFEELKQGKDFCEIVSKIEDMSRV